MSIHSQVVPDLRSIVRRDEYVPEVSNEQPQERSRRWEELLTPHLHAVLSGSGAFSDEQTAEHCDFFDRYVVPWLGPSPIETSHDGPLERVGPISRLTKDGTPLEFSYVWKNSSEGKVPAVRYVVDIAAQEPGSIRCKSLERSLSALRDFHTIAASQERTLNIVTFWDVWNEVTTQMLNFDNSKHCNKPCARCSASGMYLGFELQGSKVKLKPYWLLPTCATTTELLGLMDDVVVGCEPLDPFYGSEKFLTEWSNIREHISTVDRGPYLHPCLLSLDATIAPSQRFKLYTRCIFPGSADFEDWNHHLPASGAVEVRPSYLQTLGGLWEDLRAPEEDWSGEERTARPNFIWVQYEITAKSNAQSKVYIMCPETPRPDNFINSTLLKHCEILRGAKLIESLAATKEPTDFSTVIAVTPGKPIPEIALYFTPAIFANTEWKGRYKTNGYFTKVRNRVFKSPS